jgi:hypothetical protein
MTAAGTEKPKKSCFAIAPIGAKDSETRKRSDKVLKHIFRKALEDKYKVERGDEIDEPGMITSQVLRAVQGAHLVVADLTEHNPNVLYELAVRHAIEKPIIHVIEPRISKIPFDIGGFRTIEFDLTDPDSIEAAVDKLRKFAEQAEAGNWGETPIKLANIMRASKDDSPEMLLLKQAVEGISTVAAKLENLEAPVPTAFSGWGNPRLMPLGSLGGVPIANAGYSFKDGVMTFSPSPDLVLKTPTGIEIVQVKTQETPEPKKEGKEPPQPKTGPKK